MNFNNFPFEQNSTIGLSIYILYNTLCNILCNYASTIEQLFDFFRIFKFKKLAEIMYFNILKYSKVIS